MEQYLKEIISIIKSQKMEMSEEKVDQWENKRENKLYRSATSSKKLLNLLSVLSLLSVFGGFWPVAISLFGISALVWFTLYKEHDLRYVTASHNLRQAKLLDLSLKLASERGATLGIEPQVNLDGIMPSFLSASVSKLELVAFLHEGETKRRFFTARIPLSVQHDSPFSVDHPGRTKIDVWFDEKTLKELTQNTSTGTP